jgi:LPS-assembly lipoprotein
VKTAAVRMAVRWLVVSLAGFLVAACGFHLQGSVELPSVMGHTYIESANPDGLLTRKLTRALQNSGSVVTAERAAATAVLRLLKDDAGQRVLSVSARGVPEEYELYHTVRFSLEGGGGTLLEPYETTVTRDYSFDPTEVLGKAQEAEYLEDAMVDDIVQLVLRRLSFLR